MNVTFHLPLNNAASSQSWIVWPIVSPKCERNWIAPKIYI